MIEKFKPKTKAAKAAEDAMIMGRPAPKSAPEDDANGDGVTDAAEPMPEDELGDELGYDAESESDMSEGDDMGSPEKCVETALTDAGVSDPTGIAATVIQALRDDGYLA